MRRSLLFIPANTPAMLQNADIFGADAVIFDLEDAVLVSEKDAARTLLNTFFSMPFPKTMERIIRINSVETPFYTLDLNELISDEIDTIMLPKATETTVKDLSKRLKKIESEKKMEKTIKIIPIIERAVALFQLDRIAKIDRVDGLLLGAEDLATELEAVRTKAGQEILMARSLVVAAAKAYGKDAIDTPFVDTKDDQGLIKDAQHAKALGMNAKACIHPNQIVYIHDVFNPSEEDIEAALKIIKHKALPENKHKGAFSLDGKMIDKPVIQRAEKVIAKAKQWKII
ncbi:MAG: HpcH/HpaI aldolase/citrate lyase family protein [Acholeplasmataceae bacterium]